MAMRLRSKTTDKTTDKATGKTTNKTGMFPKITRVPKTTTKVEPIPPVTANPFNVNSRIKQLKSIGKRNKAIMKNLFGD
jgi:hypothetical protein